MAERVLITGGSGFVGACLARDRVAAGDDLHLLLRPGYRAWRLAGLGGRFTPQLADLRDPGEVRRAVAAARPDVVYHLAAEGTMPAAHDRGAVLATNLAGTANLLSALAGREFRALVHAGSSSEYGHRPGPMREADALAPRTDYAVGKAAASLLVLSEGFRGMPVSVVRIFSAYGPWEDPVRIASAVMASCARGERPRVGHGGQPRDFVYVDDVVALLRLAAGPAARGRVLHAGTGRPQTVRDLVEAVVTCCGGPPAEYGAVPTRSDEPAAWVADIEQTTALTGWRPRIDLAAGVARMWDWFRAADRRAA